MYTLTLLIGRTEASRGQPECQRKWCTFVTMVKKLIIQCMYQNKLFFKN